MSVVRTKVGIVGAGDIFPAYAKGLAEQPGVELVGVADLRLQAAAARAAEAGVRACSLAELLDSEAEIIVNLTPPAAHRAVGEQVLAAGRHLYTEKPLAASYADGCALMEAAARAGRRVGCAPDTFLGSAGQLARAWVDAGRLGRVVAGQACMMERGPDDWHPNPAFFYGPGAGPLMDMGVYYLSQLVQLLGPVRQVNGMARSGWAVRTVPRGPRQGERIDVNTPTHVVAGLDFESGAFVTLTTSFDVWRHQAPQLELYGELGSLSLPDPNRFDGPVQHCEADGDWQTLLPPPASLGRQRGIGVADMATALREGRAPRADGALGLHVLEIMDAVLRAADAGQALGLQTRCERPAPLNEDGR